jgi:hypothetical protein
MIVWIDYQATIILRKEEIPRTVTTNSEYGIKSCRTPSLLLLSDTNWYPVRKINCCRRTGSVADLVIRGGGVVVVVGAEVKKLKNLKNFFLGMVSTGQIRSLTLHRNVPQLNLFFDHLDCNHNLVIQLFLLDESHVDILVLSRNFQ